MLASDIKHKEEYRIVGLDPEYQVYRAGLVVYLLEDNTFEHDIYLRSLEYKFHTMKEVKGTMKYTFRQGGFGFKLIEGHSVLWDVTP